MYRKDAVRSKCWCQPYHSTLAPSGAVGDAVRGKCWSPPPDHSGSAVSPAMGVNNYRERSVPGYRPVHRPRRTNNVRGHSGPPCRGPFTSRARPTVPADTPTWPPLWAYPSPRAARQQRDLPAPCPPVNRRTPSPIPLTGRRSEPRGVDGPVRCPRFSFPAENGVPVHLTTPRGKGILLGSPRQARLLIENLGVGVGK
jgi:hypothetical protein